MDIQEEFPISKYGCEPIDYPICVGLELTQQGFPPKYIGEKMDAASRWYLDNFRNNTLTDETIEDMKRMAIEDGDVGASVNLDLQETYEILDRAAKAVLSKFGFSEQELERLRKEVRELVQ